jgi:hypothetical protein
MKVRKKGLKIEKICVDIVLCPKTNLYLQSLYCHKCAYFKLDEEMYIICNYEKPQVKILDKKTENLLSFFSRVNEKRKRSNHKVADKEDDSILKTKELLKADLFKRMQQRNSNLLKA